MASKIPSISRILILCVLISYICLFRCSHTFGCTNCLCLLLFLSVRGSGEAALVWIDPKGEEISEDSDKPYKEKWIDEVSKELEMNLTDPSSGGVFWCKGTFDSGDEVTIPIKIHVVRK